MSAPGTLDAEQRRRDLAAMADQELDVLVVGGGVVGAGAALDAVTRGLRVGLVEAQDWAGGTSSRSSKLVHGGLRYLEQLELGLVREALRERSLMLHRLCPHLVRPVPFLYPLTHRGWERLYVGAGVALYDLLGGRRGVPGHRHLSRRAALEEFPGLRADALVGAIRYYDGQVDDARHTMTVVRTAARHGALCANRARATGFLVTDGAVVGARVRDEENGTETEVRARRVINAAGVWTEELQALAGGSAGFGVRASKGVHLVVPRHTIPASTGLISRAGDSVLFVIPWGEHWIVGTTDTDHTGSLEDPSATTHDVRYLLDQANRLLSRPLTEDDVVGVFAGLRPLVAGTAGATTRLSREHTVASPVPGLVVIAGGKYTTYRVMARDAVDAAVRGLLGVPRSCTERVPLLGADGFAADWNRRHRLAAEHDLPVEQVEHLLGRYGSLVHDVLSLVTADPALGRPLTHTPGHLRVEIVYAVRAEGALHLEDLLERRTRIALHSPADGAAAREIARLAGPLLEVPASARPA